MIRFEHVGKVYGSAGAGQVVALDDVSCTVATGEIFGILGRSGAGKTTLLRCLALLEQPTSGRITLDDVDLTGLRAAELRQARRRIGMVFQHFNLLASRTVAENIAFPLEIAGVTKTEIATRVAELVDLVGLTGRADAYPAQLSGGQKQRVGIARALAGRPDVLLCDEATSALDPTTTEQILDLIADINARTGVTVVLITHEAEVVRRICHSAVLMADGRVVEQGPLLELMRRPESRLADILLPVNAVEPAIGRTLTLSFAHDDVELPVLSSLTRDLGIDVSILGGTIERVAGHQVGRLRVALTAPLSTVDEAQVERYLTAREIAVSWSTLSPASELLPGQEAAREPVDPTGRADRTPEFDAVRPPAPRSGDGRLDPTTGRLEEQA